MRITIHGFIDEVLELGEVAGLCCGDNAWKTSRLLWLMLSAQPDLATLSGLLEDTAVRIVEGRADDRTIIEAIRVVYVSLPDAMLDNLAELAQSIGVYSWLESATRICVHGVCGGSFCFEFSNDSVNVNVDVEGVLGCIGGVRIRYRGTAADVALNIRGEQLWMQVPRDLGEVEAIAHIIAFTLSTLTPKLFEGFTIGLKTLYLPMGRQALARVAPSVIAVLLRDARPIFTLSSIIERNVIAEVFSLEVPPEALHEASRLLDAIGARLVSLDGEPRAEYRGRVYRVSQAPPKVAEALLLSKALALTPLHAYLFIEEPGEGLACEERIRLVDKLVEALESLHARSILAFISSQPTPKLRVHYLRGS